MIENITTELILDYLKRNEVKFKPTQSRLCLPIINRLYRKMANGLTFEGIKITEDLIIDGHHRYLAAFLSKKELDITLSSRTSSTIITKWDVIEFVQEDWDTKPKIQMLNEQDAKFNNMTINEIEALLQ